MPKTRIRTPAAAVLTEISVTPNPADKNARLLRHQEEPMPTELESITREAEVPPAGFVRALVHVAGLGPEVADQLIDERADDAKVRETVQSAVEERRRSQPVIRVHGSGTDDPTVIRARAADALAYRMGGLAELPEESRPYADVSLIDLARQDLERTGTSTRGMTRDEVLHRTAAHTTSDFALTVMDASHKTAMASYRTAECALKPLFRKTTLRDFKTSHAVRLGEMGELKEMAENGEFTATTRGEEGEALALKTYGRRIDQSRNLIISDDLGLFGDTVRAFGEAAAQTEATLMVAAITGNPKMRDGKAVFHASRNNIATVTGIPSKATLTAAREAMRTRTGTDGKTLVDAKPRYLVVSAELETEAEEVLATIQPGTTADVNPFSGNLTLLVEPRLPSGTWYLFADPARLAALRYGYLAGAEGVQVQRREAWDTLGLSFRAYLDFGVGWLDWRAAHRVAV